jgi:hypothetical protein
MAFWISRRNASSTRSIRRDISSPGYPKVPEDAYVDHLRKHAADLGITLSGTGVRNNFTTADKEVRTTGVNHIKEWVEVAARLGVPVIRVFADTQMKGADLAHGIEWSFARGRSRLDLGGAARVRGSGEEVQGEDRRAESRRLSADRGRVAGARQERGLRLVRTDRGYGLLQDAGSRTWTSRRSLPHAVNWQVKQSVFGEDSEVKTDMIRLLKIVRKSGYKGFLPIETLSPQGKPYDPYAVVPAFREELVEAIRKTA